MAHYLASTRSPSTRPLDSLYGRVGSIALSTFPGSPTGDMGPAVPRELRIPVYYFNLSKRQFSFYEHSPPLSRMLTYIPSSPDTAIPTSIFLQPGLEPRPL